MTAIEADLNEPTLEQDNLQNEWWNPDVQNADETEAITEMLEKLFTLPEAEDKREFAHELSDLIRSFFGTSRLAFALNAGDGSILSAFDAAYCFGIEQEEKRARRRQGRYQAIVGDLNRVSKLIEPLSESLFGDTIVVIREATQVEDLLEFLNANQDDEALITFVYSPELYPDAHAATDVLPGVFAIIEGEATSVAFAAPTKRLKPDRPAAQSRKATKDTLDLLGPWVEQQKTEHVTRDYRYSSTNYAKSTKDVFVAVHREYGRRFLRPDRTYDIELFNRNTINYDPSAWCHMALNANSHLGDLKARIHNRNLAFFAQNSGLWKELLILEDESLILIDPLVKEAIAPIIEAGERITTPLRPLKPQERLGFIGETSKIKCLVSDEEKDLVAGKWYTVAPRQYEYAKQFSKTENVKGVLQLVKKKRRYYHQRITIAGRFNFYDDDPEDIAYLLKHFEIPQKKDIQTRYPEDFNAAFEKLTTVEKTYLEPRGFAFKAYQKRDIAALAVNNRGVLAWQQGLGKTPGGVAFAIQAALTKALIAGEDAKAKGKEMPVLIIAPQDLIPQWQSEARKFFGLELKWIGRHKGQAGRGPREVNDGNGGTSIAGGAVKNLIEAREIAKSIREGAGGFYITHFEALTSGGSRNLRKIEEPYTIRMEKEQDWVAPTWIGEGADRKFIEGHWEDKEREVTTAEECPECGRKFHVKNQLICNGWHQHPAGATRCTWTRYIYRLPNIGKILSTTFREGVIVVDEGTQIASARNATEQDSSQKTKAVCGLRARHRLVMSGTPVKNFIAQAFWLLWWGIGDKSERFNYAYAGGKGEFAKDYTVVEWTYNDETGNWHKQQEVGEVTNHTKLWAQLASVLLRRVKEETGELIVKKQTHIIPAPLGYYQREQLDFWLRHFPDLFAEKYPNDPKVKRGTHRQMAAVLGLDHKLNYAAVMPEADPDYAWTSVPVSNYTPAAYKALETIMALVAQGRRVLVGTDVKKATPWLAARLTEKGIRTRTMLKGNGTGDTLDPADRSKVVEEFQNGDIQVLCTTQKAIRLGHNLDAGSAVVLLGLDWDYETYAQFTERVHRLTSVSPVDVYIVIPGEKDITMIGRKWDRISDKAKGAGMAIDGHIPEQNEDPPDIAEIVREMMKNGIPATGKEIRESDVLAAWEKVPQIEEFEIPDNFALEQAKPWIIDWDKANEALAQHLAVKEEWQKEEETWAEADLLALAALCRETVNKSACEALDAFLVGATNTEVLVEEVVTDVTKSSDLPLGPESAVAEPFSEETVIAEIEDTTEPEAIPPVAPAPVLDPMSQLKQAKELLDMEILTQEEFNDLKSALLEQVKKGVAA